VINDNDDKSATLSQRLEARALECGGALLYTPAPERTVHGVSMTFEQLEAFALGVQAETLRKTSLLCHVIAGSNRIQRSGALACAEVINESIDMLGMPDRADRKGCAYCWAAGFCADKCRYCGKVYAHG
jgi:hypothetical protein